MASSFPGQIPSIIYLLQKLYPKYILDIGKGFGKYGFLVHEYIGIDNQKRIDPTLTLAQQSNIKLEAVEADADLLLPHLEQIYSKVHVGDVLTIYKDLPDYNMVLLIDVVEHLEKDKTIEMIKYFLSKGSMLLIATPLEYFQQELYESDFEHHISHWTLKDFKMLGYVQYQYFDGGGVYLLSKQPIEIRGFGNSFLKKIRRFGRTFRNEFN